MYLKSVGITEYRFTNEDILNQFDKSIDFLNSLNFLTKEDKEGIFYGNAATFLKLETRY